MNLIDINIDCLSLIFDLVNIQNKLILHKTNKMIKSYGLCKIDKKYTNKFIYWCEINDINYNKPFIEYWKKIDEYKKKYSDIYISKNPWTWGSKDFFKFPLIEELRFNVSITGIWGVLEISEKNSYRNRLVLQNTYGISFDQRLWQEFWPIQCGMSTRPNLIISIKEKDKNKYIKSIYPISFLFGNWNVYNI